ncbi:DUF3467 domain-containing protein [Candidatus Woesearchaeota archaeon]|nr:DUF3467 domain-containing protein [Candidatus Woesearchaeota archaeon]
MPEEEERINLHINEGEPFFAHELSINFNPTQFVFDFKCITPRVDPRSQTKASISLKHNVIMVDPYHAKKVLDLLNEVVKKYEKEFGKIEKPKSIEEFEKKHKKKAKEKKDTTEAPSYFG